MSPVSTWIRRFENLISFSALGVLLLTVLWGVFTRYITERPAVWTTELSGILFTWVVFVGALTAFRDSQHIRVTLLTDTLPSNVRKFISKFGELATLAFLAYVTYLSLVMMQKGASRPSPVLNIPFSWVYLATVISFCGMTATSFLRFIGVLSESDEEREEAP